MANVNAPFGLAVAKGGGSYASNQRANMYSIPTSDSTNAYYMGDTVKAAASGDANGVPNVTKITNGTDPIRGVIVGIIPAGTFPNPLQYPGASSSLSLETNYVPATKAVPYYVLVEDDPTTIFVMQDDGITTANLVAASCNLNFSYTVTAGGTTNSSSGSVILSSSFATTTSLSMKALGLAQGPWDGVPNVFGAYAKWLCRINLSELTGSFAGV
jgi:hypothetical protein